MSSTAYAHVRFLDGALAIKQKGQQIMRLSNGEVLPSWPCADRLA